jgi:hypothetical protein
MVEVVISFTDGAESGDEMITRGMFVVKRSFTEPMSEGVDAEGGLAKGKKKKKKKKKKEDIAFIS